MQTKTRVTAKKEAERKKENKFIGAIRATGAYKAVAAVGGFFGRHQPLGLILLSFALNFYIEAISRHSVGEALDYMLGHPLFFAYNILILLLTLSVPLFFPHRRFLTFLIAFAWFGLGTANGILLLYRITPLVAIDFALISSVFSITNTYMKPFQVVLLIAGFVAAFALIIIAAIKVPKTKVFFKKAIAIVLPLALCVAVTTIFMTRVEAEEEKISEKYDIAQKYKTLGFVYCFSDGLLDRGIDKPDNYGEDAIEELKSKSGIGDKVRATAETPDIIMLQLETFIDPQRMKNISFSEDAVPFFRSLASSFPSGYIRVPTIGAGTVKTEFEVLTGMSLSYFGTGEYPYNTVLGRRACETVCTDLAGIGYSSTAIHNHFGTFYNRHEIYSNLGFERFIPIEYMTDVEYNTIDWARDKTLLKPIKETLESATSPSFIYGISVQCHGMYPSENTPETTIRATGSGTEESDWQLSYYASQLREVDDFLRELVAYLSAREAPTVLVMFGDHLPNLTIDAESLEGSEFQTEYVIWSNYETPEVLEDEDIDAYMLTSRVFRAIGIEGGVITALHNSSLDDEEKSSALQMLQYDMLYGKCYISGGINPYSGTNIKIGLRQPEITAVEQNGEDVYIKGSDFTPACRVYAGLWKQECEYISEELLIIRDYTLGRDTEIYVAVCSEEGHVYGESNRYVTVTHKNSITEFSGETTR